MAKADPELPTAGLPGDRVRWYHSLSTRIAAWSGLLILLFLPALYTAWFRIKPAADGDHAPAYAKREEDTKTATAVGPALVVER